MNSDKWAYIAYIIIWLSTGIVASIAIWITKSVEPLCIMLIPAFLSIIFLLFL